MTQTNRKLQHSNVVSLKSGIWIGKFNEILMGRPRDQSWTFLCCTTVFTTSRCFVRKLQMSRFFGGYFVKQDHDRGSHISTFRKPTIDIQIANDHLSFNVINLRYVPYSIINEIEVVYVTQWVLMLLWTFSFMKVSDDVQHKYNSITKEKGAEYKKILIINEWMKWTWSDTSVAYENMNKKYSRTMRNRKHTCPSIWTLSSVKVFSLCTHTDKCTEILTLFFLIHLFFCALSLCIIS